MTLPRPPTSEQARALLEVLGIDINGETASVEIPVAIVGAHASLIDFSFRTQHEFFHEYLKPLRGLIESLGVPPATVDRHSARLLRAIGNAYIAAAALADTRAEQFEQHLPPVDEP